MPNVVVSCSCGNSDRNYMINTELNKHIYLLIDWNGFGLKANHNRLLTYCKQLNTLICSFLISFAMHTTYKIPSL